MIGFEFQEEHKNHPDVRLVRTHPEHKHAVTEAYLRGCKVCQQVISKCVCATPEATERLLWDRETGVYTQMYMKHLYDEQSHQRRADIFNNNFGRKAFNA